MDNRYIVTLLAATTSAATSSAYESTSFKGDQVIYAQGLSGSEKVLVQIQDPLTGTFSALYDNNTNAQVFISATTPPLEIINYWGTFKFVKPTTANAVAIVAVNKIGA